jgi:hypothetical protein
MIQGLNVRDKLGLYFTADMRAVNYLHLGQYFAPNFEPATEEPRLQRGDGKPTRGGNMRNAPWPTNRQDRIHAVTRIVHKWEEWGLVRTYRPWLDCPKWVSITIEGLRRLGLDYNDAPFPDEDDLDHLFQVTRVRLIVGRRPEEPEAAWFQHSWISERALKSCYPQNTAGIVLPHLPDGALELDEDAEVKMADGEKVLFRRGSRIAAEIERRRKDFRRMDAILPDLLKHYNGVWYFCQPKAADAILATKLRLVQEGVLTRTQAKLIRVLDLEEQE